MVSALEELAGTCRFTPCGQSTDRGIPGAVGAQREGNRSRDERPMSGEMKDTAQEQRSLLGRVSI